MATGTKIPDRYRVSHQLSLRFVQGYQDALAGREAMRDHELRAAQDEESRAAYRDGYEAGKQSRLAGV